MSIQVRDREAVDPTARGRGATGGGYRVDTEWSVLSKVGLDIRENGGVGSWIVDAEGRRYLDLFLGAGAIGLGHRHPTIVGALRDATDVVDIGSFLLRSDAKEQLARALTDLGPGDLRSAYFVASGSEAVDLGIKVAMGVTGRSGVAAFVGAYHGHTQGALRVTNRDYYRSAFGVGASDARWLDPSEPALDDIDESIACVVLEGVQGEGGARVVSDEVLLAIRERCRAVGAMLLADEIQAGLGRTGRWWAAEVCQPDLVAVGKLLGGGIDPVAALLLSPAITEFVRGRPFAHFSTFGGSNLGCRVASATLDVLTGIDAPATAMAVGATFRSVLERAKDARPDLVAEVRGRGVMLACRLTSANGPRLSAALAARGVLCLYSVNDPTCIRVYPSLLATAEEAACFEEALGGALTALPAPKR